MKEEKLINLKPPFQKKIFERVVEKTGSSLKAGKHLKIPASSIRGYKNLYFKTVPERLLQTLISNEFLSNKELLENTLEINYKSQIVNSSLDKGREIKLEKIRNLKKAIPKIKDIIIKDRLNLFLWFKAYEPLLNSGFRKVLVDEKKDYLLLNYSNFTQGSFRNFCKKLPKEFILNDEFSYFLGLWCGDRSGGKRFGVINQQKNLLDFTEKFLSKNHQIVERILYCSEDSKETNLKFDKKVVIKKKSPGWAISVHATNGILSSFFYFLFRNIDFLLKNTLNKDAFFAGLFDAEGNVSLYNKSLRWACKDEKLISVYTKYLDKKGLYKRYDGACIINYNLQGFYNNIFPHMKHTSKIKDIRFLLDGKYSDMPNSIREVFLFVKNHPLKTQKEITKALKKSKVYFELRLLRKFGFIVSEGFPLHFKLNKEIKK